MNILFFYIDNRASSGFSASLGLVSIAGYLNQRQVDTDLVYFKSDADISYALEKIQATQPRIIGFYSTSTHFKTVQHLSTLIKNRFEDIYQVFGGVHTILVPEVLEDMSEMDAVCVGYGEKPLFELTQRLECGEDPAGISGLWVKSKHTKKITRTSPFFPKDNPDDYLYFNYDMFLREFERFPDYDPKTQMLEVIFNRSCPFLCTFCCASKIEEVYGKAKFRPSVKASIALLERGMTTTGFKTVAIHDDIFNIRKKWFRPFMEDYAKKIRLPFICNLRIGTFDEEDIRALKKANIQTAWVGIESGNNDIRQRVMKKNISEKTIVEALELLHKYDINVSAQNLVGLPFETPEKFMDTIRLNAIVKPNYAMLSIFHPYPKTEMYDICVEQGWYNPDTEEDVVERTESVLDMPDFTKDQINFYFRHFSSLVTYQRWRFRFPKLFFVPLTTSTSQVIGPVLTAAGFFKRVLRILKKRWDKNVQQMKH